MVIKKDLIMSMTEKMPPRDSCDTMVSSSTEFEKPESKYRIFIIIL